MNTSVSAGFFMSYNNTSYTSDTLDGNTGYTSDTLDGNTSHTSDTLDGNTSWGRGLITACTTDYTACSVLITACGLVIANNTGEFNYNNSEYTEGSLNNTSWTEA